ncbi:MAG: FkbM family methyltransferase [Roseimicrobium sp.]
MNTATATCPQPAPTLSELWNDFRIRWRFKFVLPRVKRTTLEGVELDISTLSSVLKNRLLDGRYEAPERRIAAKHLSPDDRVLELGGAIGFIGLYCQRNLGIRSYTTVEANPATVELLKKNYTLNGCTPNVIHAAATGEDGELELHVGAEFWCDSIIPGEERGRKVTVPALSLGTLFQRLDYEATTLICDIEGAEQHLDFSAVPASVKKILIELHPWIIGCPATYQIVANLVQAGFRVQEMEEQTYLFLRD